uniref:CCHC-type domain-containing protein n=1 Tax=Oryza brachyantha TaxID=4533 RepID=J3ND15_ORYBR
MGDQGKQPPGFQSSNWLEVEKPFQNFQGNPSNFSDKERIGEMDKSNFGQRSDKTGPVFPVKQLEWGKKDGAVDQNRQTEQGNRTQVLKCFRCGQDGHHQATCSKPPLCYACHQIGHICANCPLNLNMKEVKLCGFGILGQGFYSLHIESNVEERSNIPVRASVMASNMTEEAIDELTSIWVKMTGVPKIARNESAIKALTDMMGEFEEIDTRSVNAEGPIRVKCACIDPRELHIAVHFYINKDKDGKGDEKKDGNKDRDDEEGGFGDDDLLDDEEEDPMFKKLSEKSLYRSKGSRSAPPATKKKSFVEMVTSDKKSDIITKESVHCSQALVVWEGVVGQESQDDNLSLCAPDLQMDMNIDNVLCLAADKLGEEEKCDIPTDSDIEKQMEEDELEEINQFKEVSYKKKEALKKKGPQMPTRMSLRHKAKEIPVSLKAEILTQKKNLEATDNEYINSIANVVSIVLGSDKEEIDKNITTIKAKEVAQAKIAELVGNKNMRMRFRKPGDLVGVQETKKESFSKGELNNIRKGNFKWAWKASREAS